MTDFVELSKLVGRQFDEEVKTLLLSIFDGEELVFNGDDKYLTVRGKGVTFGVYQNSIEQIAFTCKPSQYFQDSQKIDEDNNYHGELINGLEFGLDSQALDTNLGLPLFIRSLGPRLPPPLNASDEEFEAHMALLESRRGEVEDRFYKFPSSESLLLVCELNLGTFCSAIIWNNNEHLKAEAYEYAGKFAHALQVYLRMDESTFKCLDLIRCYRKLGNIDDERIQTQKALKQILPRKWRAALEQRLTEIDL